MNTPAKKFKKLLDQVITYFPTISFVSGELFSWSDEDQTIFYDVNGEHPEWSLLHELGHMSHKHDAYHSDTALIRIEMEAWSSALTIAQDYGIVIDEEHIQDCMDSYRHWQQKRSACPRCSLAGVEITSGSYRCISCRSEWEVGADRFCRVYRRKSVATI